MNEPVTVKNNWPLRMVKVDRIAAWILFAVIILYGITGYGMTRGIISTTAARALHLGWLGGIGLGAFVVHTGWAIHLFFKRHNSWNVFSKFGLILFYVLLTGFFLWAQFFYHNSADTIIQNTVVANTIFTPASLQNFNGLNGQPAYVAIDGVVYDLSPVFINGRHYGYSAGQDLSAAFHNKHPDSYLKKYPIVGSFNN